MKHWPEVWPMLFNGFTSPQTKNQMRTTEGARTAISAMEKTIDRDKTRRYERKYYPFRSNREEKNEYEFT